MAKQQKKKNPPCIISGHILEKNNTCTFPTAAEDSQTRQLSREPSGKEKGKRPRTQGVCRQSGRLLKIARNSHAAGSQRQKAGRFRKEQPQKEAGERFFQYTKSSTDFRLKQKKNLRKGSALRSSESWYRGIILGLKIK